MTDPARQHQAQPTLRFLPEHLRARLRSSGTEHTPAASQPYTLCTAKAFGNKQETSYKVILKQTGFKPYLYTYKANSTAAFNRSFFFVFFKRVKESVKASLFSR